MWFLVPIAGAIVGAIAVGYAVDAINDALKEGRRAEALDRLARMRREQDADLADVYRRHFHRMTPETRALFEAALGGR